MDKKEFRVLIKYCFLKRKTIVEATTWFGAEFPDTNPGKSTIKDWYAKFRRGEMSIEDGERSGRSKEDVTDKNIKTIHKMILNVRKLKLNDIADIIENPLRGKTQQPTGNRTTKMVSKSWWVAIISLSPLNGIILNKKN
ncbi:hypothetical protein GWI33_011313 [Rhynchophorus ferrugineus]|uniref:Mos1 transposase HTH domain-containing protein n=1 Tax=Rhynchophorus ferrugineus TaxID=354439 RepID=A0A834M9I9_RHYFE|nr:hypothetical protein GWI33_011313 [Rhynchophorus ferrugineus]